MQALADQSRIVRVPMNRVGSLNKINRTFSTLEQTYQREPSNDEVARELEMSLEELDNTLGMGGRHVSVHAPFSQGEEGSLLDVLEDESEEMPDSGLLVDSLRKEISRSLSTLTEREKDVIELYFGLNGGHANSLEEIGEKFMLTRERVRQIKEKGLRRLRVTSRSKALKHFLG
jgi:RNA polymerase primary sigma factor